MIRDCNSARSIKWFARNELDNPICEQYVRNLCVYEFGFEDYEVKDFELNRKALYLTYNDCNYIICISRKDVGLVILEEHIDKKSKSRYKRLFGNECYGDKCWYECLDKVKNNKLVK